MYKQELDELLERGVLSQDEYSEFFKTMYANEEGQMIGTKPNGTCSNKYDFDGNLIDGSLLEFVLKEITPPLESEYIDDVFKKYGITVCGIYDGWHWFRKDNISKQAIGLGYKPIEEATETELWKIIAISSRYWEVFYKRSYYHLK